MLLSEKGVVMNNEWTKTWGARELIELKGSTDNSQRNE